MYNVYVCMYVYIHINPELMMLIAYGKVKTYSIYSINFRMNVCVYICIYTAATPEEKISIFLGAPINGIFRWDMF